MTKTTNDFSIEITWSITAWNQTVITCIVYPERGDSYENVIIYRNRTNDYAVDELIKELSKGGSSLVFSYLSKLWYEKIDNRDLVNNR